MSLESAEQLREVRDLIARVLPGDLEILVHDRLGVQLANLVGPGPHLHRVFELLQACEARGWLDALLDGVAAERQENPEVALLMQRLGLPTKSSMAGGVAVAASTGARGESAVGTAAPHVGSDALSKRRDEELQALVKQLHDAYARQKRNEEIGEPTTEITIEILNLKRRLREGGQLRVGDRLGADGRYQLIEQVGRGGFAVVWKAKDRRDDIYVAVKVLHPNLSGDSHRRERFFRGARMMQRLDHAAVVRVLDPFCEDGGFSYFVMEFVPNGNLHDVVLRKQIAGNDALIHVIRVGEALAKAHAQGMVHRDIKPQNILLDEKLEAKLTDFDLVGAGDTTGGTRTGSLGTAVYAAPECLHKPQEATAPADVFGLGMTAIFCLLRQELTMDTYLDLCRDPAETLAELGCAVPIRSVLARAVARKPKQRFADAGELVAALRQSLVTPEPATITQTPPTLNMDKDEGPRASTTSDGIPGPMGTLNSAIPPPPPSDSRRLAATLLPARPISRPPVTPPQVVSRPRTSDERRHRESGAVEVYSPAPPSAELPPSERPGQYAQHKKHSGRIPIDGLKERAAVPVPVPGATPTRLPVTTRSGTSTGDAVIMTRPAVIVGRPQNSTGTVPRIRKARKDEGRDRGQGLINEKSLDEVVLAYLSEDADEK